MHFQVNFTPRLLPQGRVEQAERYKQGGSHVAVRGNGERPCARLAKQRWWRSGGRQQRTQRRWSHGAGFQLHGGGAGGGGRAEPTGARCCVVYVAGDGGAVLQVTVRHLEPVRLHH